jgi:ribosomal protein S12 methylthiotransferase
MRALLHASSFEEVDDPALASVVVVNTCSFITEATEESLAVIFELLGQDRVLTGEAKVVVAGCLPARYTGELAVELPEVAAFVGVEEEDDIVSVLQRVTASTAVQTHAARPLAPRIVDKPWAYVKISDGCDRYCSFCTIPFIRGRYKSTPATDLLAEIAFLVAGGVREVILIGQDTGIWGKDLKAQSAPAPKNLAQLLALFATRFPTTWFRVMYLQPEGLTEELLAVMAAHPNICHYLDIPLQHASASVLKAMNRAGSGQEYLELLSRIRTVLPDVTLRTTLICGFPGETRADARELERFVAAADFDYVGVFVYSQEEGTVAGRREDQVPLRTRKARAQRLRDLADRLGFAKNEAQLGTLVEVLVVEEDEDLGAAGDELRFLGRSKGQAPDVDGMVHLATGVPGTLQSVRIVGAYCYELDGEVV